MSYITEFRDYDGNFYIPEGWEDYSWHNDVCPHASLFKVKDDVEIEICIWQDYVDINKRDAGRREHPRYIFSIIVNGSWIFYYVTDDLEEIKKFVTMVDL